MAALRVRRPINHHCQLRGTRPRGASAQARQDRPRPEPRVNGDLFSWDILCRGEPQDPRAWFRPSSWFLSSQYLEHHGLFRRGDRVSSTLHMQYYFII